MLEMVVQTAQSGQQLKSVQVFLIVMILQMREMGLLKITMERVEVVLMMQKMEVILIMDLLILQRKVKHGTMIWPYYDKKKRPF